MVPQYKFFLPRALGDRITGLVLKSKCGLKKQKYSSCFPFSFLSPLTSLLGCNRPLGMENYHIPDSAIAASSRVGYLGIILFLRL